MNCFISILFVVTLCNLSDCMAPEVNISAISLDKNTDYLVQKFGSNFAELRKRLGFKNIRQRKFLSNNEPIDCLSSADMLMLVSNGSNTTELTKEGLLKLCPYLLLSIDARVCRYPKLSKLKVDQNNLLIWVFSITAVIICSLVGLVVVWLIPIIPKSYYHCISQLLIGLAVGSLTGDALLHLIPHALLDEGKGGHSHGNGSQHSTMVWKALVALVGIHIFFLTERITILCQNVHSKRKSRLKQLSQDFSDNHQHSHHGNTDLASTTHNSHGNHVNHNDHQHKSPNNKKHWASKSRKYSENFNEGDSCGGETIGVQLCNKPQTKPHVNADCPDSMNLVLCQESTNNTHTTSDVFNPTTNTEISNLTTPDGPNIPGDFNAHFSSYEEKATKINNNRKPHEHSAEGTRPSKDSNNGNWSNNEADKLISDMSLDSKLILSIVPSQQQQQQSENLVQHQQSPQKLAVNHHVHHIGAGGATVQESLAHPFKNKPHGHHHGHSHDLSSVKSIAYTVIAGDGLHNFCDGIAIGAAFANDLRGGMSTAIAVLCHELPHELGDFVVLLHAGMSIRTAIFYNLLSSIFCAAGMVIGVLLGNLPNVSSWVFMLTAGMFLYIALVDMIPELSTRRLQGKKWVHRPSVLFLFQNLGLIAGICIMLVIALFEDRMF